MNKTSVNEKTSRPSEFSMKIHSGMLETMGHNMYSSVAKCLAEFVSNAYDADAETVEISMDFSKIDAAKREVRKTAKLQKAQGLRKDISAIYDPLPQDITVQIKDDGHGMSPDEIQRYFMAITRNRRKDENGEQTKFFTESGKRRVMGRKGVGKLAGFGAAEHIKIESKRAGFTYSTTFEMDYSEIKNNEDLSKATFAAQYKDTVNVDEHYTIVTLSQLRCDSLKSSKDSITTTLSRTFCVLDHGFEIKLNDDIVKEVEIDWEFSYPIGLENDKFAKAEVTVNPEDDSAKFDIEYIIRFRARPNDHNTDEQVKKKRSSLPAERRGARIYCHGRLSHGPSLLDLHSGVHNFHAQDYMECIVKADPIDQFEHDCIVTSREGLNKDNPIVSALFAKVTDLMKDALKEHYKHRDKIIVEAIEDDEFSKGILSPLQSINPKSRKAAKEILKVVGKEHGVNSSTYKEMAPILLQAMNASDVLTKLIELETDPKSIHVLAHSMAELTRMEKSDLLKLYRGRTKAIGALQKLHEEALGQKKGKGYERELHSLFKQSPWLIKPEFSSYLTSDKGLADVCRTLNAYLKIDEVISPSDVNYNDETRPDLVFVACDRVAPDEVIIVELKSPGIELQNSHLTQLEEYMFKVEEHLSKLLSKTVRVQGFLIGTKPDSKTTSTEKRLLLKKISDTTPNSQYKIVDILELIAHAKNIHQNGIEYFQAEEEQLTDELS